MSLLIESGVTATAGGLAPGTVPSPDELAVWFHYEEVAMHFNQMLIQFRLQLLGGAGGLATVAMYLIGEKVHEEQRPRLRALASSALLVIVVAAGMFDLGYYNQLLRGAVDALLEFERQHPSLYLSTRIERAASSWMWWTYGAYALVTAVIGLHTLTSWWSYWWGPRKVSPSSSVSHPALETASPSMETGGSNSGKNQKLSLEDE